jgi:hypothetical protein
MAVRFCIGHLNFIKPTRVFRNLEIERTGVSESCVWVSIKPNGQCQSQCTGRSSTGVFTKRNEGDETFV